MYTDLSAVDDGREGKPSASGLDRLRLCPGSWAAEALMPPEVSSADAEAEVLQAQADELAREYNLDESDAAGEVRNPSEEGQGQEGYALEFPEGFQATAEFTSLATPIARELGLDGKQAGAYAAGVIRAIQQEEQANFRKTDAALKEKWGREYRANRAEAQRFYNLCLECGDFSPDDLRVLHSPKGVELLYKMSQRVGEGRSATPVVAGRQSDAEWAQAVYHDPRHPDYRALRDVDDPRFEKVRERYNRAMGLTM